jgi:hypothetical protein
MISTSIAANDYDRGRGVDGQHALADPTINLLAIKLKNQQEKWRSRKTSRRAPRNGASQQSYCNLIKAI